MKNTKNMKNNTNMKNKRITIMIECITRMKEKEEGEKE